MEAAEKINAKLVRLVTSTFETERKISTTVQAGCGALA
jgi:hypothetical protein